VVQNEDEFHKHSVTNLFFTNDLYSFVGDLTALSVARLADHNGRAG
jgi:hypothetical protein